MKSKMKRLMLQHGFEDDDINLALQELNLILNELTPDERVEDIEILDYTVGKVVRVHCSYKDIVGWVAVLPCNFKYNKDKNEI